MSRIGKIPIKIPENVQVLIEKKTSGGKVIISGPKGSLFQEFPGVLEVKNQEGNIVVERKNNSRPARALQGTIRALLNNMVGGVTQGYQKQLVLYGVGYRAAIEGDQLFLSLGFSHRVPIKQPEGITFLVSDDKIIISGIDKKLVGEVADKIRKIKPPEPYKGKGIRYFGEKIKKKVGKKAIVAA